MCVAGGLAGGMGAHHAGVAAQHLHPVQAAGDSPRRVRLKALGADAHKDLAVRGAGHIHGRLAAQLEDAALHFALKHVDGRRAQEFRHKQVLGVVVDLLGGALLHQ